MEGPIEVENEVVLIKALVQYSLYLEVGGRLRWDEMCVMRSERLFTMFECSSFLPRRIDHDHFGLILIVVDSEEVISYLYHVFPLLNYPPIFFFIGLLPC
jgi:hypothetical protein